jgi:hypothetical protein
VKDEIIGTFQLIGVGRNKVSKRVTVRNNQEFYRALKSCGIMSEDINWGYDPDTGKGVIVVGGFRNVGEFERVVGEA